MKTLNLQDLETLEKVQTKAETIVQNAQAILELAIAIEVDNRNLTQAQREMLQDRMRVITRMLDLMPVETMVEVRRMLAEVT